MSWSSIERRFRAWSCSLEQYRFRKADPRRRWKFASGRKRTIVPGSTFKSAFAYADILVTSHDPPHRSRPLTSLPPGACSELVRARWRLLCNELSLVGGLVIDRLKTGAGHCNDEFAVPDVNHNTVEMRSQGQSFRSRSQMTILPGPKKKARQNAGPKLTSSFTYQDCLPYQSSTSFLT